MLNKKIAFLKHGIFLILCFLFIKLYSQPQIVDGTAAVVGDEAVLISDVYNQLNQLKESGADKVSLEPCWILDQLMQTKLLVSRARIDSVLVSSEEIEGELNRRIQYFIAQIGSEEQLESFYGKSISEIKDEFRKSIEEQLLADKMKNSITNSVEVTPNEVKKYYNKLPTDSLPYYSAEVEVSQIIFYPKLSFNKKKESIEKLRKIRQKILNGTSFSSQALAYSRDEGSRKQGGRLGMVSLNALVPEFAAVAKILKKDSISDVVETEFGFHILQVLDRKGDRADIRHILIKPEFDTESYSEMERRADSVYRLLRTDTLKFSTAAFLFSDDKNTRSRGGSLADPKTNASKMPVDELDKELYFIVDTMKEGSFTAPIPYTSFDGKEGYRIVYLKTKVPSHKANLKDDYPALKNMAIQFKKVEKMEAWFKKYIPLTFIRVNSNFQDCQTLAKWERDKLK